MAQDVFKILKDLEYKACGVDPKSNKMQEGYFVSFRSIGLPIPKEDFYNPWTPTGGQMKNINSDAVKTASAFAAGSDSSAAAPAKLDMNQLLTAGVGSSLMSYLNTFMLTDDKLVMNNNYAVMPDASHVSDAWFAIINGANAVTSDLQLSDAIKKSVQEAQDKILDKDGNPTAHFNAYNQYRQLYQDAAKAQNKAYAGAMSDPLKYSNWPINGKQYQDDVDYTWSQWMGFGFKEEIENALSILAAQGIDPAVALIARAKLKYENSLINFEKVGNIPYTFIIPSKWYSLDEDDGWTQYTQNDMHSESHADSSSSSFSAAGGLNLGFFNIGASASGGQSQSSMDWKTSNLKISFEYCCADVQRPWLDTTLLRLGNWFLVGNYPKNCISNGNMGQELKTTTNESTFLPSIVTSFILVRNLVIYWDEMSQHQDTFESHASGGMAMGIGPFMCGGSYSRGNKKSNFSFDFQSDGLHIEGVQLIGYVSAITPASPRLDSKNYMQKKTEPQPVDAGH